MMEDRIMNKKIRIAIMNYLNVHGKQNTRTIISMFAKQFNTSKQRISGNLRAMKYNFNAINIVTYVPGSFSEMM